MSASSDIVDAVWDYITAEIEDDQPVPRIDRKAAERAIEGMLDDMRSDARKEMQTECVDAVAGLRP